MKKKYLLIIIAVVALVIIGFASGVFGQKESESIVTTIELDKTDIVETVSGTGKIQPEIEIKLSSEVSGEIINLPVKEGQVVKKGDLLVEINPDLYESIVDRNKAILATSVAGLSQAEAQLTEAQASYNRYKTLYKKGVISGSEWDKVVSTYEVAKATQNSAFYNVESAKAAVTEAQRNLLRTSIYSPTYGTISRIDVELGERVLGTQQMAGTELMRVANLSRMEVEVNINENDIVKIKEGDETRINVDAYLKKEFRGIVTSISNSASNQTLSADQVTTFKVKIQILEESYKDLIDSRIENYSPFRPGMTAAVDIITNVKNGIYGVPISAVIMRSPTDTVRNAETSKKVYDKELMKEAVFVNQKGVAKLRFVKTGIQDDKNIEIVAGLEKGDEVITGPYSLVSRTLQHGDKIKVE
ncbi:efflux RND transporter periplasmic adaptor subunit [Myroides sp. LoEW2-1]|uniref:efflux RND transporter periplasmic adaptor subunit n=1 Tax=Myroides sp. LoEW2-1 TaxID=2683192 RepID=UPI001326B409|nr:efflux RND transporter periplasmic adaptor subunit [Myroides sp. LoEW2-1]MVX36933.1 efflux RND transporter periplasmic adaptor subunit [Myroides sp. LoEW2-1]